jgi:type IV pilus assembly protein PilB
MKKNKSLNNIENILLDKRIINEEQLNKAKDLQEKEGVSLKDAVVNLGFSTYSKISDAIAESYNLSTIELDEINIPYEVIDLVPVGLIQKYQIMPVSKSNNAITIAVSTPPDIEFIDNLRFILNLDIKCVLATKESIKNAIHKYYKIESTKDVGTLLKELEYQETVNKEEIKSLRGSQKKADLSEQDAPIIQLVSLVISKAVNARASDIHVEPLSNRLRIRYRIDGVCHEVEALPKQLKDQIISRIKILANIDISEKRRPQDGHMSYRHKDKNFDIRVSCLPSIYGESIVMRLLEKSSMMINLRNLGLGENDYERFNSIIKRPNGILLITGPTGSGKTTTLYAAINELNKPDVKIITAEDPVEYVVSGVNQSEVNDKIGLNFPVILRTMLRQDPDIILVGEIRDTETANTAIAAALTGHFVFSTIHTNDTSSTITRLIDMGIKPFLVASSLQGIVAQRLVRMICAECKIPVNYTPDQIMKMGFDAEPLKDVTFYKGNGCKSCNKIGYHGRSGIYEILDMNEMIQDMVYNIAPIDEIRKAAIKYGMSTLKEDGLKKAKEGITTLEEVFRIVGLEDL